MPSLGTLTVYLKADIKDLDAKLSQAAKSITKFSASVGKMTKPMQKDFTGNIRESVASLSAEIIALQRKIGVFGKVKGGLVQTADGWKKSALTITASTKSMSQAISNWSKRSILSMLSLQKMTAKIVHYITFSVGVQMVMAIKKGFSDMISSFTDFERAATNATTVSGYMGRSFAKVKKRIMDISKTLAKKTVFSALDVATAFYNLASAGIDVGKVTEDQLAPILNYAAATQSSLEDATYAVLTAMKAFGLTMEDTERIVDTFTGAITNSFFTMQKMQEFMKYTAPIAGALGISLEETVAAGMSLVNMGLSGAQAGQRLNMIFTKLLKSTDKAKRMLSDLGLSIESINPEVYSLTEILWKLNAAGFGAAEAATMFRARTAASATVLVNSVKDIERYNAQLVMSKGITKEVASAQEDTLWGAFQLMRNALQNAALDIGGVLLPYLKSFASFIKDTAAPAIVKFFNTFIKMLPGILKVVGTFIKLYAVLKVGYKIFMLTRSALMMLKIATLAKAQANITAASSSAAVAAGITAEGEAAAAATPALITAATAVSILTGGIAAIVTAIALWKSGIFDLIDTFTTFDASISTSQDRIESLKESINDMVYASEDVAGVMIWLSESTSKSFADMWKTLQKTGDLGKALGLSDLQVEIDKQTSKLLTMNPYEIVFSAWAKEAGIGGEEIGKQLASAFEQTFKAKRIEAMIVEVSPIEKFWRWITGQGPIKGTEGLTKQFQEVFKRAGKEMPGNAEDIIKSLFDTLGIETTAGVKDWSVQLTNNIDQLLVSGIAIALGKSVDEVKKQFDELRFAISISTELWNLQEAFKDLDLAETEFINTQKSLNDIMKKESATLSEISTAEENYRKAVEHREKATVNLMEAIGSYITTSRAYSAVTNSLVQLLEDTLKTERELISAKEDLTDAMREEEQAQRDLADALAVYGSQSEEVINAEARLYKAAKRRSELEIQVSNLSQAAEMTRKQYEYQQKYGVELEKTYNDLKEMGYSHEEILKMIEKYPKKVKEQFLPGSDQYMGEALKVTLELSEAEKTIITLTEKIARGREELANIMAKEAVLRGTLKGLQEFEERYLKISNEKLKLYLESQLKVFEIELKLYKLRKGETKQMEALFDKLAETGMINNDIINAYTDMEESQGNLLGLNQDFIEVYGDLTDNQRQLVEDYINGKISLDEFNDAMLSSSELTKDGNKITQEQIDVISAWKDANDDLISSTENFKDLLGPLLEDLIDIGAISPEVADAWLGIADNAYEAAKANTELLITQGNLNDAMEGMVKNSVKLFKALVDENVAISGGRSSAEDLFDVYKRYDKAGNIVENAGKTILQVMLEEMGLWEDLGGNINNVEGIIEHFYGKSLSQLSDAQIITAITMIKAAKAAGVWTDDMTAANLATELGIASLAGLEDSASDAMKDEKSLAEVNEDLAETISLLAEKFDDLQDALEEFVKTVNDYSPLEFSIRYEFGELADTDRIKNNFRNLLKEMNKENLIFTADMTRAWEQVDFEAFGEMMKSELGTEFSEALLSLDLPLEETFVDAAGDINWETVFKNYPNKINDLFKTFQIYLPIYTKWDGIDWDDYISKLDSADKTKLMNIIDKFSAEFNITDRWGPDGKFKTFDEWMSNLKLTQLVSLGAVLENANLPPLPVDINMADLYLQILKLKDLDIPENYMDIILKLTNLETIKEEIPKSWTISLKFKKEWEGKTSSVPEKPSKGGPVRPQTVPPETVKKAVSKLRDILHGRFSQLRDFGKARGGIFDEPTFGIFGEAGPEALIPLTGVNRYHGKKLLIDILPKYFPDLLRDITASEMYLKEIKRGLAIHRLIKPRDIKFGIYKKPTPVIFGESGPEALVPLAGKQKKFGEKILSQIIPKYYPNLIKLAEYGGVAGVSNINRNITYNTEPSRVEEFNIIGPINVTGVANVDEFVSQLKYKARAAGVRK